MGSADVGLSVGSSFFSVLSVSTLVDLPCTMGGHIMPWTSLRDGMNRGDRMGTAEQKARVEIDSLLSQAGWAEDPSVGVASERPHADTVGGWLKGLDEREGR